MRLLGGRRSTLSRTIAFDNVVIGGQDADGNRASRTAGERERLTAATFEIDVASLALPAWLTHPLIPPMLVEGVGASPDPFEPVITYRVEFQGRDVGRGWARENVSVRSYCERDATPPVHAGLRELGVIVGDRPPS
jgi:hypothetical protein